MTILSIDTWPTNGHLIAQVAELGYIPGRVFDATYGEGVFWRQWQPETLVTNDLRKPADHAWDWTEPAHTHRTDLGWFETVVFDPPYKLNGTPTDSDRFGVDEKVPVAERMRRLLVGAEHCAALVELGGCLLVKCQNQVANGEMYWQTDDVDDVVKPAGFKKQAMFHRVGTPRKQRSQKRARNNYSTLLVYQRTKEMNL